MDPPVCPACDVTLARERGPRGMLFRCPSCDGRMAALAVLRRERAKANDDVGPRAAGRRGPPALPALPSRHGGGEERLLRLRREFVAALRGLARDGGVLAGIEPDALAAEADVARLEISRATEAEEETGGPQEAWKHLPAAFGLPVQLDTPTPVARPWATWIVAGALAAAFLASLVDLHGAVRRWGFLPEEAWRAGGLTIPTSFLLHGGVWRLLGNLYFFVVFGDDVEDRVGPGRFLLLLLLGHLAGLTLHAAYDPSPDVPLVGASAGIFAVIAYFAVSTPKARLAFLWIVRGGVGWVRTPALTLLFLYVGLQLFGAWQEVHGYSSASALGHLGGLGVGILAALVPRLRDRVEGREAVPGP